VKLFMSIVVGALALAGPAAAGQIVVNLDFLPGTLSVQHVMAHTSPDRPVRIPVTVVDARGDGAGWTLRFVGPAAPAVTSITAGCAPGSTCTLPEAVSAPNGSTVLQAARGTGMGVIRLVVTVAPGSAQAVSFAIS